MTDEEEIIMINETLKKLRVHFEAKGKIFMLAWFLSTPLPNDVFRNQWNFISTTAQASHRYHAVSRWTHMVVDGIDRDENKRQDEWKR